MRQKRFCLAAVVLAAGLLAACAAPTPQVIEKQVVVEKEVPVTVEVEKEVVVEKPVVQIVEVVVTATPLPTPKTPIRITGVWLSYGNFHYSLKSEDEETVSVVTSLWVDGTKVEEDRVVLHAGHWDFKFNYIWSCSGDSDDVKVCVDETTCSEDRWSCH